MAQSKGVTNVLRKCPLTKYGISIVDVIRMQIQAVQLDVRAKLPKGGTTLPANAAVHVWPMVGARLRNVHAQTRT